MASMKKFVTKKIAADEVCELVSLI